MPIRFLINQCQIITFLILKYDIMENSRIEFRGIVLPVQMGGLLGGWLRSSVHQYEPKLLKSYQQIELIDKLIYMYIYVVRF